MQIYLLNGPPRCGKDFAAVRLAKHQMKMAKRLKEATHAALGLCGYAGTPLGHAYFEGVKDQPRPEFGGRTPREAYIQMSEGFLKPLFGEDILGRWLADDIQRMLHPSATFAVSDSGFRPEARAIVDRFGADMVTLIRIHREGKTFAGDSRGYIELADLGVRECDVVNDGTPNFEEVLHAAAQR